MADVREFKGMRAKDSLVDRIAELPYDVLDSEEARAIAEGKETSFFHVDKPEIDLPVGTDLYSDAVYAKGAENLKLFIEKGYIIQEKEPVLYLYTLVMNGRAQTGLVSCVSIDDYLNNTVKIHEYTREEKEKDRIRHMEALNAQVGLVFLMYRQDDSLRSVMSEAMKCDVLYDFVTDDKIRHIVRVISNTDLISRIKKAFNSKNLYIADGHHRAASAVKLGVKRREQGLKGEHDSFMSVLFPHDELFIMPYNRAVKDLNGLTEKEFIEKLSADFKITKSGLSQPAKTRTFSMYFQNEWYTIEPLFQITNDPVLSLDVSILQEKVLSPLLGIDNPRTSKRIDFIGGIRGTKELEKLVQSKDFAIAFSMYPTTIDQLLAVSDAGKVMPPKSTWFEPKLRSGIILHSI